MDVQNNFLTVTEYEKLADAPHNAERKLELLNGELIETMPTELHGAIAAAIAAFLFLFVKQHNLGRVTVEARHRIPDDDHNARVPDVAFTSAARALSITEKGSVPYMPDLAIEIKSPDDPIARMRQKAGYYLDNGSRLVWLIYPEKQLIEVYHADGSIDILTANDTLLGGDVLPDFRLNVQAVFDV